MKTANKIVMALVGLVLIGAAVLKVHQILTTVIPGFADIQAEYAGFEFIMRVMECRELMIFHVPLEMGLGIWLCCGLFRKVGWLLGILTFTFFAFVTAYKVFNGYADCGCFGVVKIDPRITLFAVDIPFVVLLLIFWPRGVKLLKPWPSGRHFFAVAIPTFAVLIAVTVFLLAVPAVKPEPLAEVGKIWDKLEHISASEQLSEGMWVVMMYHNDCPNCVEAIPDYEVLAAEYEGSINFAFIEIPPYGKPEDSIISDDSQVLVGRMDDSKNWMIQTPRVILLVDSQVIKAWEVDAPGIDEIFGAIE